MMEKKSNLFHYFKGELRWAASTSRAWFGLLRKDRRAAIQHLREGVQSPEFRKRAGLWYSTTTVSFNKVRLTAPMLVGAVTFLYYALNQTSLVSSLGFGILAGFVTHIALMVLPFALIASLPALAFFLILAMLPANIPEPDEHKHEQQVTTEFRDAVEGQQNASNSSPVNASQTKDHNQAERAGDLLAAENRLKPNHVMASKFDGSERPFLIRLLEYDGSVILRDPAEVKIVSNWINHVRKAQAEMDTLHKAVGQLTSLKVAVGQKALFELGLLDRGSYRTTSRPGTNLSEIERIEGNERRMQERFRLATDAALGITHLDVFEDGSTKAEHLEENGEPAAPPLKEKKLISPRGHGYIFMSNADLSGRESPLLICAAMRDIVRGYVQATNDKQMISAFRLLKNVGSDPQAYFQSLNRDRGISLEYIEDQVLDGEVRDTAAQRLARCYAECMDGIKEYHDYIAHQQMVSSLARIVLSKAHKAVVDAEAKERRARIADREGRSAPLYGNPSRTPLKTTAQRRAELKAFVDAAIPTDPLTREGR
tara:strand:- start:976 stop:2595 length:1620 start_codon:yes stop_codon:yes gene_type:complete